MDELTLVARLRDGYPAGVDLSEPERLLAAEITAASSAGSGSGRGARRRRSARTGRRFGPKLVAVGAVAATIAATAVIALQNVPTSPAARVGGSSRTSADARGLRLADFASQAAASEPAWQPNQWVYSDILRPQALPKPGATNPTISWTQVDGHQFAYYRDEKLVIRNEVPYLGQLTSVFEKTVTEGGKYCICCRCRDPGGTASGHREQPGNLPDTEGTAPARHWQLRSVANNRDDADGHRLPPRLLAAVYGILATDPAVHFDKSVTDNAGQTGVGFYMTEGVWRYEIMINPSTYAYMGVEAVAVATWSQHWTLTESPTPGSSRRARRAGRTWLLAASCSTLGRSPEQGISAEDLTPGALGVQSAKPGGRDRVKATVSRSAARRGGLGRGGSQRRAPGAARGREPGSARYGGWWRLAGRRRCRAARVPRVRRGLLPGGRGRLDEADQALGEVAGVQWLEGQARGYREHTVAQHPVQGWVKLRRPLDR